MTNFASLGLRPELVRAVDALGYETPTPIQLQAIPPLLEGRDLLGSAQTGTGKTAAFALPLLQFLADEPKKRKPGFPRALIVTPTRELAIQIDDNIAEYGTHLDIRHTVIFGGVKQGRQVSELKRGIDVLTATPGRLLDLIGQGFIDLAEIEIFTLDEADRMLDMGFLPDVKRIIRELPDRRHNLFFSATMPPDIVRLSDSLLHDPVRVEVTPESTTAEKVIQRVIFVDGEGKKDLLRQVCSDERVDRALVFSRTKHGANRIVKRLEKSGIPAAAIHGNKSQNARQKALGQFKDGEITVLVATDVAARGIDIDGITHVINYDLPNVPETYVHRIGRTARAGASGLAIAFCDRDEIEYLRDIEHLIGERVKVAGDRIGLPDHELEPPPVGATRRRSPSSAPKKRSGGGGNRGGGRGRGRGRGGRGGRR